MAGCYMSGADGAGVLVGLALPRDRPRRPSEPEGGEQVARFRDALEAANTSILELEPGPAGQGARDVGREDLARAGCRQDPRRLVDGDPADP